ncbi:MAG: DUF2971 domain-containing protein [Clostridiales bacterium]|nr:DUF2971 domain-containing protein [Clostridiales bacterium]
MKIFSELMSDNDFINRVIEIINGTCGDKYTIPVKKPDLYRYMKISEYAVNDITNNRITVTSVKEYNDMFDCGMCIYSDEEQLSKLVEDDLEELRKYGIETNSLKESSRTYFETEADLKQRTIDYMGAHLCCFSPVDSSVLMWAHYGDSNRGICVKYDFSGEINPLNLYTFPVAYRDKPINVSSLLYKKDTDYPYSIELAVMVSILCKSLDWKYENEWRFISPLFPDSDKRSRYQLMNLPRIKELIFGYHFLRNCYGDNWEIGIRNISKLLDYSLNNNIPVFIMLQDVGRFEMIKQKIDPAKASFFMKRNFIRKRNDDHLYHVIQKSFMRDVCGYNK